MQRHTATPEPSDNPEIVLGVLSALERDSAMTQRRLSQELNIALGLTNAYLKRCVRKGLIKMRQAPMRRYVYYLTPQGFAEKARLTAEYLSVSLGFFRRARRQSAALFADLARRGWRRVALVGAGDLAEVAVLSAAEMGLEVVGIVDPQSAGTRCAGIAVTANFETLPTFDGMVITALVPTEELRQGAFAAAASRGLGPDGAGVAELDLSPGARGEGEPR